jgi:hypothetical protein
VLSSLAKTYFLIQALSNFLQAGINTWVLVHKFLVEMDMVLNFLMASFTNPLVPPLFLLCLSHLGFLVGPIPKKLWLGYIPTQ